MASTWVHTGCANDPSSIALTGSRVVRLRIACMECTFPTVEAFVLAVCQKSTRWVREIRLTPYCAAVHRTVIVWETYNTDQVYARHNSTPARAGVVTVAKHLITHQERMPEDYSFVGVVASMACRFRTPPRGHGCDAKSPLYFSRGSPESSTIRFHGST